MLFVSMLKYARTLGNIIDRCHRPQLLEGISLDPDRYQFPSQ
jgi:hypothetical protein